MTHMITPINEGIWRVYQISIQTDIRRGAASKSINEYLQSIGFTQTQISPTMQFERGVNFASLYSMNPKLHKTFISVDFASRDGMTIIELGMRINCLGNMPLRKDYEFWAAELSGIADSLEYGYANPRISDLAAERAFWFNMSVMLIMIMLIVALVSVSLLAFWVMWVPM